jgi:hypothetical protein
MTGSTGSDRFTAEYTEDAEKIMGHRCPECHKLCYCHGDIDDIDFGESDDCGCTCYLDHVLYDDDFYDDFYDGEDDED